MKKRVAAITKESSEMTKKVTAKLLKENLANKETLEEKQGVLDNQLKQAQGTEEMIKNLHKSALDAKLQVEKTASLQLKEQVEKSAQAHEQQSKAFAQVGLHM